MSPSLPPEILDLIVGQLHRQRATLKTCCLVSKSWVSRTRALLFAHVLFHPLLSPIESWMRTFPDPFNSPAHYARGLSIDPPRIVTTASMDAHVWIRSFRNVASLSVHSFRVNNSQISLAQLHGLFPVLESLTFSLSSVPSSELFKLACSFPSLKDLSLLHPENQPDIEWTIPSTSPKLTGSLTLVASDGIQSNVRRLLDLPGGLHFSRISVLCPDRDAESIAQLVSRCSETVEFLSIYYHNHDLSSMFPSA